MNAASIFNDLYEHMTEARASVRVGGREVIEKALCSGIETIREDTDQGTVAATGIMLRILAANAVSGKMELGDRLEVKMDADTVWRKLRIRGKMPTGGVMRYSLEAEYA